MQAPGCSAPAAACRAAPAALHPHSAQLGEQAGAAQVQLGQCLAQGLGVRHHMHHAVVCWLASTEGQAHKRAGGRRVSGRAGRPRAGLHACGRQQGNQPKQPCNQPSQPSQASQPTTPRGWGARACDVGRDGLRAQHEGAVVVHVLKRAQGAALRVVQPAAGAAARPCGRVKAAGGQGGTAAASRARRQRPATAAPARAAAPRRRRRRTGWTALRTAPRPRAPARQSTAPGP